MVFGCNIRQKWRERYQSFAMFKKFSFYKWLRVKIFTVYTPPNILPPLPSLKQDLKHHPSNPPQKKNMSKESSLIAFINQGSAGMWFIKGESFGAKSTFFLVRTGVIPGNPIPPSPCNRWTLSLGFDTPTNSLWGRGGGVQSPYEAAKSSNFFHLSFSFSQRIYK